MHCQQINKKAINRRQSTPFVVAHLDTLLRAGYFGIISRYLDDEANMELQLLSNNEEAIPIVAKWYVDEWGHLEGVRTLPNMITGLRDYLNQDKIPLMVLALEADEVLGVAQLKFREMDIYPEKEHWLGGVYVSNSYRGNNIARKIIIKLVSIAEELRVNKLYLQTVRLDGGLYAELGWKPLEQVKYRGQQVLVMEKKLGA